MSEPGDINFDTLKPEEFENYLPELFATGEGKVSQDPRLAKFLAKNPDCAALVRDLETIAETARNLLLGDPSDKVWSNIQSKLREESVFTHGDGEDVGEGVSGRLQEASGDEDLGDGVREID